MSDDDSTPPAGFRKIPGFPRYAIDENGTILSICRHGAGARQNRPWSDARRLRLSMAQGYYKADLFHDGHSRTFHVHVLVLLTFVGPNPEGMECRHIDGNRLNLQQMMFLKFGDDVQWENCFMS